MKALNTILCMILFIGGTAFADEPKQTEHEKSYINVPGEIRGQVLDSQTKEGKPFASVSLLQNGQTITGTTTDENGFYKIKPVNAGTYTMQFSHLGYQLLQKEKVLVYSDQITYVNVTLQGMDMGLPPVVVEDWEIPLVDPGICGKIEIITADEIAVSPAGRDVESQVLVRTPSAKPSRDGKSVSIRGSRFGSTQYIIDGIKVIGSLALPQTSIDQMSIMTGGIPAQYGDATGGFVVITTKTFGDM